MLNYFLFCLNIYITSATKWMEIIGDNWKHVAERKMEELRIVNNIYIEKNRKNKNVNGMVLDFQKSS